MGYRESELDHISVGALGDGVSDECATGVGGSAGLRGDILLEGRLVGMSGWDAVVGAVGGAAEVHTIIARGSIVGHAGPWGGVRGVGHELGEAASILGAWSAPK